MNLFRRIYVLIIFNFRTFSDSLVQKMPIKGLKNTGKLEFIIVDDDSSDNSRGIIYDYINKDERFKYIHSCEGDKSLSYKKKALDAGIKISQYDYLMFTDAGCRLSKDWAKSMINQYKDGKNYIIGLSFVNEAKNLVSKFQKIDLFMLMISTLSSSKLNYPLASTGQNLSYKKDIFLSMHGFSNISNLMMGDDTIFMQICLKNNLVKPCVSINTDSYINSKIIKYIAEVNKFKFNKFTPGTNIKIISEHEAKLKKPDYFLVLPWHFKDHIIKRESRYLRNGGKLIFPLPDIEIV